MALPKNDSATEVEVINLVKEEEAKERLEAVKNLAKGQTLEGEIAAKETPSSAAAVTEDKQISEPTKNNLQAVNSNPVEFLKSLGIDDVKLDFTSFPKVVLNDGFFSTDEQPKFGTEFEFVFLNKRSGFLWTGTPQRTKENPDPENELVYSDDGITENETGTTIAEYVEEWKEKDYIIDHKEYIFVVGRFISEAHHGELVQLQVSPRSKGKLNGYLIDAGSLGIDPTKVVTKVSIGAEVGSGKKAFTPWVFKRGDSLI